MGKATPKFKRTLDQCTEGNRRTQYKNYDYSRKVN